MIDIGRIAYQSYIEHLTSDEYKKWGEKWEEIGKLQQDAWRKAACAVLEYIDQSKAELDDEIID